MEQKPKTVNQVIAEYNEFRRRDQPKLDWPNLIGRLKGRHVFLIGNSPSLKKLPNTWAESLSDPRLFTCAINRAIMWMTPRFWWVADSETIFDRDYKDYHKNPDGCQGGNVPKSYDENFDGVRLWWERLCRRTRRKHFIPWGWGFERYFCQTSRLDNLRKYPESDLLSIQVFMGIMQARRIIFAGVDHAVVDGETHYEIVDERDRKKQEGNRKIRFEEGEPQYGFVRQGLMRMKFHAQNCGAEIVTVSPVEGTIVRDLFPYMPLEKAIEDALKNYEELGPDDLEDLKNHKAVLD